MEQNYDIRNRELLAVKLPLEGWPHWLEGVEVPFIVPALRIHPHCYHICTAKRQNFHWAVFLGRFNFNIYLITLPKLSSVRKTVTVVLDHAFRIHGLPVNMVSDRGPQFVSVLSTAGGDCDSFLLVSPAD